MHIRLEFKPQDCWIGAFWKQGVEADGFEWRGATYRPRTDVWICVLPMLPIHIWWYGRAETEDEGWDAPPNWPDDGVRP